MDFLQAIFESTAKSWSVNGQYNSYDGGNLNYDSVLSNLSDTTLDLFCETARKIISNVTCLVTTAAVKYQKTGRLLLEGTAVTAVTLLELQTEMEVGGAVAAADRQRAGDELRETQSRAEKERMAKANKVFAEKASKKVWPETRTPRSSTGLTSRVRVTAGCC